MDLLIEVEKLDPLHSATSVKIDAKLTAGDFAVDWAVTKATVAWMDHTTAQGRITPMAPVSSVNFTISARGLPDYSVANGDLKTTLRFQSRVSEAAQRTIVSGFDGQAAELRLDVRVISRARVTRQSLRLLSKSEVSLVSTLTEYELNGDDHPTEVPWGETVLLKLNVTDIDGLPIKRQIDLFAGLTDDTKVKFQIQAGSNEFSAACPEDWWSYGPVGYRILIGADLIHPDLVLEINFKQSILVKVVAGGVILAGIAGLVGVLVRVTAKAENLEEAKHLLLSYLHFELVLGTPLLQLTRRHLIAATVACHSVILVFGCSF